MLTGTLIIFRRFSDPCQYLHNLKPLRSWCSRGAVVGSKLQSLVRHSPMFRPVLHHFSARSKNKFSGLCQSVTESLNVPRCSHQLNRLNCRGFRFVSFPPLPFHPPPLNLSSPRTALQSQPFQAVEKVKSGSTKRYVKPAKLFWVCCE